VSLNQQHSYYPDPAGRTEASGRTGAAAEIAERAKFIERTYLHLAGAIAAFVGLEYVFLNTPALLNFGMSMFQTSPLLVFGLFIAVSWLADSFARHQSSRPMQYLGLGLYVLAQAVIFIPMMVIAAYYGGSEIIMTSGITTLAIFAALTGIVMITKKDFSWMRNALVIVSLGAVGLIIFSMIFGFSLGIFFTVAMIVLAACYILYDTSNVMRHYHPQSYVAAALALFASVALMFMYILRLATSLSRD
jgi:hypothetical protein